MFNTVELKSTRKGLKAERNALAKILETRDHTDEESDRYEQMSEELARLSSRIEKLEGVERDEDDDPDKAAEDEDEKKDEKDDQEKDRSSRKQRSLSHLDFKISTSKSKGDSHEYSVRRAMHLGATGKPLNGLEAEHDQELRFQNPGREMHGGFLIPWDFKCRGRHRLQRRDLTTSTGTGAVGIRVENSFIELLRNRMVFDEVGGTIMANLRGKFALPRQSAATAFTWIGEGSSASGSNPTLDQVNFLPHTASCQVNLSRKFVFEASIDADTFIEQDLLKVLAINLDTTVLAGTGSGAAPTGILYQSGTTNVTVAADTGNGGVMSYADTINYETQLANSNADKGSIAFVTTPGVRGKAKVTTKASSGYPEFVWERDNTINGYKAVVTNEMPKTLTTGSVTSCHSLIYGNWEEAVLGLWSGVEILVNPYINASQGAIQYNLFQEADVELMHGASFVISTDLLLA